MENIINGILCIISVISIAVLIACMIEYWILEASESRDMFIVRALAELRGRRRRADECKTCNVVCMVRDEDIKDEIRRLKKKTRTRMTGKDKEKEG